MAGLHAVDAIVHPQQAVAVELADVVPGIFLFLVQFIVFGKVPNQGGRQQRQITGGRVVVGMRPAGGVGEVGMGQSQPLRVQVHQIDEGVLAAGHVLGQGNAGIVARLDDHALEQFVYRHPLAHFDEHLRALHAPGLLAHQYLVVLADGALRHFGQHHVGGHHLGETGRLHPLVGVVFGQHAARMEIGEQPGLGGEPWRRGHQAGRGEGGLEQESETDKQEEKPGHAFRFHGAIVTAASAKSLPEATESVPGRRVVSAVSRPPRAANRSRR